MADQMILALEGNDRPVDERDGRRNLTETFGNPVALFACERKRLRETSFRRCGHLHGTGGKIHPHDDAPRARIMPDRYRHIAPVDLHVVDMKRSRFHLILRPGVSLVYSAI